MLNVLQIFRKNGSLFASKSMLLLLLVMAVVFSEGCSKKLPCPDTGKATKQAKTTKKKKVVKPQGEDGADNAEASAAPAEEESAGSGSAAKTKVSAKKNRYTKNGLLQKKNYKSLRSNPAKKTARVKGNFFSRLFSGGSRKTKTPKAKRSKNVEPVAE